MKTSRLLVVFCVLCAASQATAATFGPLAYQGPQDSPFDVSGLGTTFFRDDFENGVDYTTIHFDAIHFDYQIIKLKSPGAYSSGSLSSDRYGNAIFGETVCTLSIPGSCTSTLGFNFDASQLGFLPQAVGIAIDNLQLYNGASVTLVAMDAQNQVVGSVTATGSTPPAIVPDFNLNETNFEITDHFTYPDYVPRGYTFLGLTRPGGIASIHIGGALLTSVSEIQYGLLIPEPSLATFMVTATAILSTLRVRKQSQ